IHDNTELDVDEVIVGVGEERGVAQSASPLRGWVGRRDKLRHDVGRTTPCWIVETGEEVLNGAPGPHRVDVVAPFIARRRAALLGVRCDYAGVYGETIAADQASFNARNDDMFEEVTKDIVIAKALVAGARERRVIRDPIFYAKAAEPAIGEIELNLAAQCALRADREYVAKDEHPDHQLWIDRGPTSVGVMRRKLDADPREIENCRNPPNLMVVRHYGLEVERIKHLPPLPLAPPHHRNSPSMAPSPRRNHGSSCSSR